MFFHFIFFHFVRLFKIQKLNNHFINFHKIDCNFNFTDVIVSVCIVFLYFLRAKIGTAETFLKEIESKGSFSLGRIGIPFLKRIEIGLFIFSSKIRPSSKYICFTATLKLSDVRHVLVIFYYLYTNKK